MAREVKRAGAFPNPPRHALPLLHARRRLAPVAVALALLTWGCASAQALEPWWHLGVGARPSALPAAGDGGGEGELVLTAENVGDVATLSEKTKGGQDGPVTLTDTLPSGLRAVAISGTAPLGGGAPGATAPMSCSLAELSCETQAPVAPYGQLEMRIEVEALPGASSGERDGLEVFGGQAPSAYVTRPVVLGRDSVGAGAGIEGYELQIESAGGKEASQAGSHPFQVTGTIALEEGADAAPVTSAPQASPASAVKDLTAELPAGLVANPGAVPRCLSWQLTGSVDGGLQDECPYQSAVGAASVTFFKPGAGTLTVTSPIFNVEPEAGEPARFGLYVPVDDVPLFLTTGVRSGPGEDWGVNLSALEVPEDAGLISARITFWGTPEDSAHDQSRGWSCLAVSQGGSPAEPCARVEESSPPAFLTLPTSCSGTLRPSLALASWSGQEGSVPLAQSLRGFGGCEALAFTPTVTATPSTQSASSPSGFSFALNFDTEGLLAGSGIAQSDLQDTVVTLPEGLTIDPSAGVGLGACSQAQYAQASLDSATGAGCPEDAKLGTVELETPLLFTTLYGSLYLAQPYENPFSEQGHPHGSLIAFYVIARSRAQRGILIKLAGKVSADPRTGRLTVSFEGDPQLPFSRFTFHFREGAQAPLISPATCGSYTAQASLTPFSSPSTPFSTGGSFQITSGVGGGPCPGAKPPFSPTIRVGTVNDAAGVFSPFFVELSRSDAMQEISSYSTSLPVGLTADLSGVPFCPEADVQAARRATGIEEENAPSCPAASLIGDTLVGTGVGSVLDYVPGELYFAGPFDGDPFSVVSVTSAVIGPFDLGTIVIRFGLRIDPTTGQVNIDPTGSEPIPTIIDGIVTHVRTIKVSIDRPGFTLNPTTCSAQPASSTLTSSLGDATTISTPFAIDNCRELHFKPKLSASTSGRTSRKRGASLSVKLTTPGRLGHEANIREVRVELPRQLPSQLATLQKACTQAQFERSVKDCPRAAIVGHASATTPILPVPLTGPAVFVSHGSREFPSLILALKGYGVSIDLVGSTFISRKGITSTTFKAVPDEPVGSFTLTLPESRHPALAAIGNLCKLAKRAPAKLRMPTTFIAQNGKTVRQDTKIAVTGCHRARRRHRVGARHRR